MHHACAIAEQLAVVQRAESLGADGMKHPSVAFGQATEIKEGVDRNFVLIFSDVGAKGAGGALATFNRSIGPFAADRGDAQLLRVHDVAATRDAMLLLDRIHRSRRRQ